MLRKHLKSFKNSKWCGLTKMVTIQEEQGSPQGKQKFLRILVIMSAKLAQVKSQQQPEKD